MTCERVEAQLSALIDKELDSETQEELTKHIAACPQCAEAWREMSLMVHASSELEPINPPERVFLAVRDHIRGAERPSWFRRWSLGWILVPAMATVLVMLVLVPNRQHTANVALAAPARSTAVETMPALATAPARIPAPEAGKRIARSTTSRPVTRVQPAASPSVFSYATEVAPVAQSEAPVRSEVVSASADMTVPDADVVASLREVQQAMEEIEAALHTNQRLPRYLPQRSGTQKPVPAWGPMRLCLCTLLLSVLPGFGLAEPTAAQARTMPAFQARRHIDQTVPARSDDSVIINCQYGNLQVSAWAPTPDSAPKAA